MTYDEKMLPTDPEGMFQQKIPQVYLQLQESIRSTVVTMKTNEKPPVIRSDEFRCEDVICSMNSDIWPISDLGIWRIFNRSKFALNPSPNPTLNPYY